MKRDLDTRIQDALMYKPDIIAQFIVCNVQPYEELGFYIGNINEDTVVYFHEYKQCGENSYEAILYDMDVRE